LAFTSSSLSVSRSLLNDSEEAFVSPFYDYYFTRPFAFFFDGSNFATITGDSGATATQQINPGEDDLVTLNFGVISGTVNINIAGLANGTYAYVNGTTVQNPQGLDDPNYFPSSWNGYYTDDIVIERVTVVPEPMTMTIMAIAGIMSARRRRRQQSA
jgi:hypothetical protein